MADDPFADKMEEIAALWADQIIEASPSDGVAGELHVSRFKALALYLVQTRKLGRKNAGMDEPGFGAIKKAITEGGRDEGQ